MKMYKVKASYGLAQLPKKQVYLKMRFARPLKITEVELDKMFAVEDKLIREKVATRIVTGKNALQGGLNTTKMTEFDIDKKTILAIEDKVNENGLIEDDNDTIF